MVLLAAGSMICCVAVNGILIPQKFFGAGFTGMALVIHYLIPRFPLAILYLMLNIPVFLLGWMYVGRRFFLQYRGHAVFFRSTGVDAGHNSPAG
jgi:uncharacterized membrane-anchored protein YitT (DUF2179 family)